MIIKPLCSIAGLLCLVLLTGCTTSPPANMDDVCEIFREKDGWYKEAAKARDEWGTPIPVMMAFIHQESRFVADAQPPRTWFLGFIPGPRKSSAYGYPQAKKETWRGYQRATGNYGHDRDDFGDAVMFIGWYNHATFERNKVPKWDSKKLYLAYHEGHGGYARGTHNNKKWLLNVSDKVASRNWMYAQQLKTCEKELRQRKKFLGIF
ncbi:Uncharacterised protein [BD1-7 clade bacterium]|uniref:Transglycosylase SLT domain-containing protein n=1 Tax=BD1-7 clade bacterium TaxID=2029982 RepID=A0A5S9N4D3_9GAMM|nr:Uncharacterised protein [BD1-7 clade bacterium]